ncbi:MAG: glutathione S-transferase N-terminal domain-containing protein [Marivivens sp.]|nr:glutathione S-transferase N-terminal domain-containing protein [Marivivens sp.]
MKPKLYCFGESGNAYKVALTLQLSEVDWDPVFVDFFHGESRSDAFRQLNPMGEIPVYVVGDKVLTQSGVILRHIARETGKFGGTNHDEDEEILRWILFDNHKLSGVAGTHRFNRNFLPKSRKNKDVNSFLSMRLNSALKQLERHLEQNDWIALGRPTIADFSCCGYLFYPEPFDFDCKALPNIDRWLTRIEALPHWKHPYDLMPGNPSDRSPGGQND